MAFYLVKCWVGNWVLQTVVLLVVQKALRLVRYWVRKRVDPKVG